MIFPVDIADIFMHMHSKTLWELTNLPSHVLGCKIAHSHVIDMQENATSLD